MYVKIGTTEYTAIRNLSFAPETDVIGGTAAVNEFSVDIKTDDEIVVGSRVSLYDDLDNLWAKYWVTYAEWLDDYTLHVIGQSAVKLLEYDMLDPVMYSGEPLANVLSLVLDRLDGEYSVDSSFDEVTITGFCPLQSARTRLQWVCLTIGAYLKNYFNDELEILPIDDTGDTIVPLSKTFWKPSVTYNEYVTAVRVFYYSYLQGTPQATDKWVEANGVYYVETATQVTLRNSNVPAIAPEHVVTVEGVTIVNQDNADDLLSHLAKYHFKRTEVDLDVIDNAEFMPGERVIVYTDEDEMAMGYVESLMFKFGVQARASMHLLAVDVKESAPLVISYEWNGVQVGQRKFTLPVEYEYTIENAFVCTWYAGHYYVFRPDDETVSGTIASGGNTVSQSVSVALDLFEGTLHVAGVDEAVADTEEEYEGGQTVTINVVEVS